jgi:hypothetical protein
MLKPFPLLFIETADQLNGVDYLVLQDVVPRRRNGKQILCGWLVSVVVGLVTSPVESAQIPWDVGSSCPPRKYVAGF